MFDQNMARCRLVTNQSILNDFERFFYDQVRHRTDFFEEPNSKIVRWRLLKHFFPIMRRFQVIFTQCVKVEN